MKYIITNKDRTSFFKQWTDIGPMFTDKQDEAMIVEDRVDFAPYLSHFAMAMYDVVEENSQ